MTDTEENIVEPDVTGFGNPSLDSDKIDDSTEAQIDNLLDEVIKSQESTTDETEAQTSISQDTEPNILDDNVEPVLEEKSQEPAPQNQPNTAEPQPVKPQLEIDPEIAAIEQPRNLSEKRP